MKNVRFLTFALALTLGACCHYESDLASLDKKMAASPTQTAFAASPADIAPAAGTPVGGSLSDDLAREYYTLAKFENDKAYDYKASAFYTKQAMTASQGKIPAPSKVSSYDIPGSMKPELTSARAELITALEGANTPENADTLAKAQTRYECWLERAEEATEASHYESCKSEFQAAMASLSTPAAGEPATTYDIAFAPAGAVIDPSSVTTMAVIAQFLNDPKNESYTANLTGFSASANTDTLMTSRVGVVRDSLIARGVAQNRLKPLVAPMMAGVEGDKVQVALMAPENAALGAATTTYVPVTPQVVDTIPQGAIVLPPASNAPAPGVVVGAPPPALMAPKTN